LLFLPTMARKGGTIGSWEGEAPTPLGVSTPPPQEKNPPPQKKTEKWERVVIGWEKRTRKKWPLLAVVGKKLTWRR